MLLITTRNSQRSEQKRSVFFQSHEQPYPQAATWSISFSNLLPQRHLFEPPTSLLFLYSLHPRASRLAGPGLVLFTWTIGSPKSLLPSPPLLCGAGPAPQRKRSRVFSYLLTVSRPNRYDVDPSQFINVAYLHWCAVAVVETLVPVCNKMS